MDQTTIQAVEAWKHAIFHDNKKGFHCDCRDCMEKYTRMKLRMDELDGKWKAVADAIK